MVPHRILKTGSGSRAPSFSTFLFYDGNVGAGYGFCIFAMESANQNSPYVPTFDGKASSFLDYEPRVILWERSTDVPPDRRSTLLISHMDPTARQVCMCNSGGGALMAGWEVRMVTQALRGYFQPDTFGRIFTQMDRFMSYVRTPAH